MSKYQITKLSNGIRVVSENIPHIQSFSLGFWFNVGSRDETKLNNGISHVLEHMFFKGTQKRSAKKIADDIESLGGYLNAFTSKEHTCFYGRGLKQHLERTFEVLADMIQNSVFDPLELEKEASVIVDELYDIEDSPEELIFDKFETAVYKGNPLNMPIIGTDKNIKSFTQQNLFDYVDSKYGSKNFYIVASGNMDHDQLVKLTEKYVTKSFGKSKPRRNGIKLKEFNNIYIEKDIQQVNVLVGKPTYGFNNPNRPAAYLLSHILGEGSSSRLFYTVREKNGIAYQINSFLNSFYDVSSFGVYFSTNENLVEKALKLVHNEFKKITERKVGQKELNKSKEALKGHLIMSQENTTNRMIRMGNSIIYHNRVKLLEESIADIEIIDSNKIYEMANELLTTDLCEVIIGPKSFIGSYK